MSSFRSIYFVGAAGIGMANLVRYYLSKGLPVAGYDRTASALYGQLVAEGAQLTTDDDPATIPAEFRNPKSTLVVRTPAVAADNRILSWFRQQGFEVVKRAELLGKITAASRGICVAGSHGKTTTSSMIAHILNGSAVGCNAFLGGILRNCDSNLILSERSPWSVVEADEYDRSFHHLRPQIAVITSVDPDHLDIYGNEENYIEAFAVFTSLIRPGGKLLVHTGLKLRPRVDDDVEVLTYSARDGGDWHARDISYDDGRLTFAIVGPGIEVPDVELGVPVDINIDNAVAAAAAAMLAGATAADVRRGLKSFLGAKRRFEFHLRQTRDEGGRVLIDDYAHSPNEVRASIASVRRLFPDRRLTVVFQPHLYTRTRDFAADFADALSGADEVLLAEIYPAREEPIPGVTSEIIFKDLRSPARRLVKRDEVPGIVAEGGREVVMTLGAADIDLIIPRIKEVLLSPKPHNL